VKKLTPLGQVFYGIAMAGVGFQQYFYADFPPMILPPSHGWIPGLSFWAYFTGTLLIAAGALIAFGKKARAVSLALGGILLGIFCLYYIPYQILVDPNYRHLGEWGSAEKELALAGGAFVIAGSIHSNPLRDGKKSFLLKFLERLIPWGGIFFSITMISFGIDHFLYTEGISTLVPGWISNHIFWTYFAAVALIGSGIAIIFKVKLNLIATLLGIMILLWLIMLHIPRAITQPTAEMGNEVTSAFSALAFIGIAFVIAGTSKSNVGSTN
jgi:uncharacterized membrane protein YphA (DoxX/SURF4 family)